MIDVVKRHWLFLLPLVVFAGYYTFQNALGFLFYPTDIVLKFCAALVLSIASYILAYRFIPLGWAESFSLGRPQPRHLERLCTLVIATFGAVMVVASLSTDAVPLIEAVKGASASDLAGHRNDFLRTRVGSGQVLNYAFAIFSQGLLPFATTYAFWTRASWRWLALGIFTAGVFLTLSKAAFLCVAAPLIALFLMQGRYRAAGAALLAFVASLAVMYVLASGLIGAWEQKSRNEPVAAKQVEMPGDVPISHNVFGEKKSPALLVANRIVWIPYATAIDWFQFQKERLNGSYVLGLSIRPIAFMLGKQRLSLETKVADFEWGDASGNTSNAVFFADAWLNWGPLGVVVYSMLFALTIKVIATSGYPPLIAASVLPVWIACFSALPPVYFSAGLGFLLLFALLVRDRQTAAKQ